MSDWKDFQIYMLDEASIVIGREVEEHREEIGQVSWNRLFDTGGPTRLQGIPARKRAYFGKVFHGFIEIDSSISTLRDIEIYISSFPYRNPRITRPRHLRYHIESYFNEIYILKERLNAYLTAVGRCFRGDPRHSSILATTRPLFGVVKNTLDGVVDTRGKHIHQNRFDHEDLDRLDMMELLVSTGMEELALFYNREYRKIRRKWKLRIKNNNDQTINLLDLYGKALNCIMFNQTKRLIYPRPKLSNTVA